MTVKVLLLIFVFAGYLFLFMLKSGIHPAFFPAIFVSGTAVVLYVFGIAGFLNAGVYAVTGGGIVCLFFAAFLMMKNGQKPDIRSYYFLCVFLFFIVSTVWIYIITRGTSLSHYDDFTHWYRICKMMNAEGAYPSMPDMKYPAYVPATATWIYYVTRFTGFTVPECFFAQDIMNAACLISFFALIPKNENRKSVLAGFLTVCIISVLLCAMDTGTYELLVDTILALAPVSAVIMTAESEHAAEHSAKRNYALARILVFTFTALIKTTGILFVLFAVFAGHFLNSDADKKDASAVSLKKEAASVCVPFLFTLSYQIRARIIYGDLSGAMQSISVTRYMSLLREKSLSNITGLTLKLLSELFLVNGAVAQVRAIWIAMAACVIACAFAVRKNPRVWKSRLVYCAVCASVWFAGLLFTYIFSMETNEANAGHLASFYRYSGTAAIYLCALVSAAFFKEAYMNEGKWQPLTKLGLLMVSLLLIGTELFHTGYMWGYKYYSKTEEYTTALWDALCVSAPENRYYTEESYVIIYDPNQLEVDNPWKFTEAAQAYFRSNAVDIMNIADILYGSFTEDEKRAIAGRTYLVSIGDMTYLGDTIADFFQLEQYEPGLIRLTQDGR